MYIHVDEKVTVLANRKHARSKLECATMCYADKRCRTAVYRTNGDCLFIKNFPDTLIIKDNSQSYDVADEILEIRTYTGRLSASVSLPLFY